MMKRKFSQKARRQLAALAGMRTTSEAEVDELFGILLQLSLALMMIFMVALFCWAKDSDSLEICKSDSLRPSVFFKRPDVF